MKKYFVVSDIHSFGEEFFNAIHSKGFEENNSNHILVVCGDLFDRGEQSVDIYNYIKNLPDERFIYVRGNHEDLLKDCADQIAHNEVISHHHISNGTVSTIMQLAGIPEKFAYSFIYDPYCIYRDVALKKISEVIDYIDKKCVDYCELGDYILVHGWIPCNASDNNIYHARHNSYTYREEWRKSNEQQWKAARWINGMLAWKQGVKEANKTIICGHWHCSYGWSHIRQKRKEFPDKSRKDWKKSFEPFIDDGIIAMDACTAYSGIINCIILEVDN